MLLQCVVWKSIGQPFMAHWPRSLEPEITILIQLLLLLLILLLLLLLFFCTEVLVLHSLGTQRLLLSVIVWVVRPLSSGGTIFIIIIKYIFILYIFIFYFYILFYFILLLLYCHYYYYYYYYYAARGKESLRFCLPSYLSVCRSVHLSFSLSAYRSVSQPANIPVHYSVVLVRHCLIKTTGDRVHTQRHVLSCSNAHNN